MKYLTQYGLSDEEIDKLYEDINDDEWEALSGSRTRVEDILEYLKSIGITNIKEIILEAPHIFLCSLEEVKNGFDECEDSEIVSKINKDASNLSLVF